jgi:hypothetical protein
VKKETFHDQIKFIVFINDVAAHTIVGKLMFLIFDSGKSLVSKAVSWLIVLLSDL